MLINTDAIVLHRMKYKNSSLIARLFTKDEGKISIVVNGAISKKGNLFGVIEPTNIIKLNYYKRNNGSLQTCQEASFISNNLFIKKDILKLTVALAIVELIDKTVHENDYNINIYHLANETLNVLNNTMQNPKLILSFFLLKIIKELGFMPNLANGEEIISQEIKKDILILEQSTIDSLNTISFTSNNDIDIITFFENYIQKHLKLNKEIQSLNAIKDLACG